MAKQKNQRGNVFSNKNVFDLNQKHLQVFQAFRLLKNTKETIGDTQKTNKKPQVFVLFFSFRELNVRFVLGKLRNLNKVAFQDSLKVLLILLYFMPIWVWVYIYMYIYIYIYI